MKRFFLVFGLFIFVSKLFSQKIWDGGGIDNNFSTAQNWSDNLAPNTGDNYVFDATSTKSCVVDIPIDASSFLVNTGYASVIDMGMNDHYFNGDLTINDGTVISTVGRLEFTNGSANFVLGGSGTFSNNGGVVAVQIKNGDFFTFSGDLVLNNLEFIQFGSSSERIINFGSNLSVENLLLVNPGSKINSFQGTLHIQSSLDLGNASYTSISNNNTGVFIFEGTSPSLIGSTSTGSGKAYLPNIEINTSGNFSITRSINVLGNWLGAQGSITAGTSTVNLHGTSATLSGTANAFDNLTIQSGASVSFAANSEIKVGRNFTNNGSINSHSTALLGLNGGSTAQTISGSAFTIGSLRAYSGSRSITLNTGLTILDSLKVESGVTFVSGGNLTLNADASLQGRIAELASGASVTGNVTVETFVPGPWTGWANWGVNGVNTQSVSHWDAQIPMTCEGCLYGVTALGEYFESIQGWDPDEQTYDTLITANTPLTPGRGFWVYVGSGFSTTNPFTLSHTGSLVQGNQSINVRDDGPGATPVEGYNLIANPFASPISWDRVWAENAVIQGDFNTSAIYVYNADLGVTTDYVPNVGSSHANGITGVIPVGQGFFVDIAFFSNVNLFINESAKVDANRVSVNPILKTSANNTRFRLKLTGPFGEFDESLLNFIPQATKHLDKLYDSRKRFSTPGYAGYPGPYDKYTTICTQVEGVNFSINSMPELNQTQSIPVLVKGMSTGVYTLSAKDFQNFNSCLVLHDNLTNADHNLLTSPYIFQMDDTTSTPRFELKICEYGNLVPVSLQENLTSQHILIFQDAISPLVKMNFETSTLAKIEVFNLLGQKLTEDRLVQGTETTTRLNVDGIDQLIFVKVSTEKEVVSKKLLLR